MTSLRQRFIEDMQVRNFSPVTQASYNAATAAITSGPVTTAAGIVIAQDVSHSHVPSGLKNKPPKFSTRTIFISSSRFPNRLLPSLTRTKISSTPYSSEPLPRPCRPSLPMIRRMPFRKVPTFFLRRLDEQFPVRVAEQRLPEKSTDCTTVGVCAKGTKKRVKHS